jgi:glycyl-tRNA synthetase (class II)
MEKIVALTKRRGFIFPSSEIYGGGVAATVGTGPDLLRPPSLRQISRSIP